MIVDKDMYRRVEIGSRNCIANDDHDNLQQKEKEGFVQEAGRKTQELYQDSSASERLSALRRDRLEMTII